MAHTPKPYTTKRGRVTMYEEVTTQGPLHSSTLYSWFLSEDLFCLVIVEWYFGVTFAAVGLSVIGPRNTKDRLANHLLHANRPPLHHNRLPTKLTCSILGTSTSAKSVSIALRLAPLRIFLVLLPLILMPPPPALPLLLSGPAPGV